MIHSLCMLGGDGPEPLPKRLSYGLAVGAVVVATLLRFVAGDWLAEDPSALFLVAVSLIAWRIGPGPGILAVALSALSQAHFFIAPEAVLLATWEQGIVLGVWCLEGTLVCAILNALRVTRARAAEGEKKLQQAHDDLETQVAARIVQLAKANSDLKREAIERNEVEEQLRQSQKMEAIGRLAGGVAHDFNNVLSVIMSLVSINLEEAPAGDLRDDLGEIGKAAERAAALTRQLLAFSRQQVIEPKVLDLRSVVNDMDKMIEHMVGPGVRVVVTSPPRLASVRMDAGHIGQVVMNLAINARDAMPTGGTLTIETSNVVLDEAFVREHVDARPGPHVLLAVGDTGVGMDVSTRARIFEPFFTTKESGKGTGLGLATVFGIVRQAGGSLVVSSELGVGTMFRIYLPSIDAVPERVAPEIARENVCGTETILLVEDEDAVRAVARAILERNGYRVLEACDGREALLVWEEHSLEIDLVLSDMAMPNMGGRELVSRLARIRGGTKLLCMSGHLDDLRRDDDALGAAVAFLPKPFTPQTLARKLRDVLDAIPPFSGLPRKSIRPSSQRRPLH